MPRDAYERLSLDGARPTQILGPNIILKDVRVHLSLVSVSGPSRSDAAGYVELICPAGSIVLVDQDGSDDGTPGILGTVCCKGNNLNLALIKTDHAGVDAFFCGKSEFADHWADEIR